LHRQQSLFDSKAATHQQLETATAQQGQLSGVVAARKADLARAEGTLATSQSQLEAAKRQREALNTKDNVYKADIAAKKAAIVVAQINLAYTRIVAPTDGTVGERHALAGQLVAPGTQVIDLVQNEVCVQANFKETQLTNMRVGDTADVRIDTFPRRVFHGKVEQLSPASGSQFALLPLTMLLATSPRSFSVCPSRLCFFRDSLISTGCGRDSRQSSPFIPIRLEDDRTVIDDRS
jgi:membrane fusion protein (multidrug efflux system)